MARGARVAIGASALVLGACAGLLSVDDVAYGPASADATSDADAAATPDACAALCAADARSDDAASDAPLVPDTSCPSSGGPLMFDAGGFCVDGTEVTIAQYQAFIEAHGSVFSGQPAYCNWNTNYLPGMGFPAGRTDVPVVGIDWCDAMAFCVWAGKRLCGAIDGGSVPPASKTDPNVDQWFHACSHGGLRRYPYGSSYVLGACNNVDTDAGALAPVATFPQCAGGYPGLFDMLGNVGEWEDACQSFDGGNDYCLVRGGSFSYPGGAGDAGDCPNASDAVPRNSTLYADLGFRCCAR